MQQLSMPDAMNSDTLSALLSLLMLIVAALLLVLVGPWGRKKRR